MIVCVIDVIFPAKINEDLYKETKAQKAKDGSIIEPSGDLEDDLESESSGEVSSDNKKSEKNAVRKRKTRREDGFSKPNNESSSKKQN